MGTPERKVKTVHKLLLHMAANLVFCFCVIIHTGFHISMALLEQVEDLVHLIYNICHITGGKAN